MVTWKCDICKKERPDAFISVISTDMSRDYDLPVGTMTMNVKHCNDNMDCITKAPEFSFKEKA